MESANPIANMFLSFHAYKPDEQETSAFERMLSQFAAHEKTEHVFLDEYREVLARHDNPLVKFLLQFIIADEDRHHEVMRTLTSALQTDLTGINTGVAMPRLGVISESEKDDLLAMTGDFIKEEKATIKDYQSLLKQSQGYHKGLLALMLKTIIHDSEKHVMILEFIDEKLRES